MNIAALIIAILMLATMITPAAWWRHPSIDAVYHGFDVPLLYVSSQGDGVTEGLVKTRSDSIELTAVPGSQPVVHLLTSPLGFHIDVAVRIVRHDHSTIPLRIGIWSARSGSGYFLTFGPWPRNLVTSEAIVHGTSGRGLTGGRVAKTEILGSYSLGRSYHVRIEFDRKAGTLRTRTSPLLSTRGGGVPPELKASSLARSEIPELFEGLRFSVTASASSDAGIASATLSNYRLTLPHQDWQARKVEDARARGLTLILLFLGVLACALRLGAWRLRLIATPALSHRPLQAGAHHSSPSGTRSYAALAISVALTVYVVLNALIFRVGSLPFDMLASKTWSYVAVKYGTLELYHLPNVITLAPVWGGVPYIDATFPYNPMMAYYFSSVGWVYKLLLAGPGPLLRDTFELESVIKGFNIAFAVATAALIYLIAGRVGVGRKAALSAGGLFLFNPAVWLSTSVWGQTHVVTLFPLLASIWTAQRRQPLLAWTILAVGALTRPQMLVPLFLLGLVFFRIFSLKENIQSASWAVIISFLLLGPFSLSLGPSLPVDVSANQWLMQEAGGNEPVLTTVSREAYNVWPLVTHLVHGATRLDRFYYPSTSRLVGALSYQEVSRFLVFGALLAAALIVVARQRPWRPLGEYLPALALGTTSFLMLKTGVASAHFVISLPLLVLLLSSFSSRQYYALVGVWTATTFTSMMGSIGYGVESAPHIAPLLHSSHNPVVAFYMHINSIDWFMTLSTMANIAVVCALIYANITGRRFAQGRT